MKTYFIELTRISDSTKVSVNAKMIGDISEEEDFNFGKTNVKYTRVGHLTHNNGGFKVKESKQEIFKLIKEL
jgi:hypothetical protein